MEYYWPDQTLNIQSMKYQLYVTLNEFKRLDFISRSVYTHTPLIKDEKNT